MGTLGDFVKKGVRLIVTEESAGAGTSTPREIPAEAIAPPSLPPPPEPTESALPAAAGFAEVYSEAGIELAPHGYGIDKVAEMLENKRLASLGREVRATAVLTALEAAGVTLADVIQDAVRRDHALDAFEASKRQELEELKSSSQTRIAAVQQAIETFLREKNAEIEALKQGADSAVEAFAQLEARKHREEERLRDVVSHFVEPAENPITTGPGATAPPAATERR
jgi:hypothetical protein